MVLAVALVGAAWAAPKSYTVDPVHSGILFKLKHNGVANFYGRFDRLSGTIVADEQDPSKSSVSITVQGESIDAYNDKRNEHLRSPDFFNKSRYLPDIKFASTKVQGGMSPRPSCWRT